MKQVLLVVLLAIAASCFTISNDNTGLKVIIKKTGIDQIVKNLLPELVKDLKSQKIADVTGDTKVAVVGEIDYQMTNITITNVQIAAFDVSLTSPNVITVAINNMDIGLSLLWAYQQKGWPHAKGNGDAVASASGSSINLGVAVSLSGGKPVLKTTVCSVNLGNFDVTVHGGISWLINLIEGLFKSNIKSAAQNAIQSSLQDQIDNQANQKIQQTSFVIPVKGANLEMDASLTEFLVTPDFLVIGDKAQLYATPSHEESPYTPAPLPDQPSTSQAGQIYIDDWVLNTAGFSAFKANALQVTILPSQIPPSSPIQLNTTALKFLLPDLYAKFPNKLIELVVTASSAPITAFTPNGINGMANGTILFNVINDDKSLTPAFILGLNSVGVIGSVGAKTWAPSRLNITGKINSLTPTVYLEKSFIGEVNVTNLNTLVRALLLGLIPSLNAKLAAGIPINLPAGLDVQNPEASLQNGYLEIAADITYTPTQTEDQEQVFVEPPRDVQLNSVLQRVKNLKRELGVLEAELQQILLSSEENAIRVN